jgi:DNA-binding CsgD family transcriptional regulator
MKQLIPELPAGITSLEVFRSGNYTATAVYMGEMMPFNQLPRHIRDWFALDLLRDKVALRHVRQMITGDPDPDVILEAFVSCRYGNYDSTPDLDGCNKLHPDAPCCGMERYCSGFGKVCRVPGNIHLSPCEYIVIRLISKGLSDDEIALQLGVTFHTVRSWMVRIREKLDLKNRVQIALWAHNHNI